MKSTSRRPLSIGTPPLGGVRWPHMVVREAFMRPILRRGSSVAPLRTRAVAFALPLSPRGQSVSTLHRGHLCQPGIHMAAVPQRLLTWRLSREPYRGFRSGGLQLGRPGRWLSQGACQEDRVRSIICILRPPFEIQIPIRGRIRGSVRPLANSTKKPCIHVRAEISGVGESPSFRSGKSRVNFRWRAVRVRGVRSTQSFLVVPKTFEDCRAVRR